jgi:hypothetical protein
MEKPVVSRHGAKGGRFIDGMYTTNHELAYVKGITIIQDTGIFSNHDLVISKIDLGIEKFTISNEKEERFDYKQIMNIPVFYKQGHDHPTLSENVFKGADFRHHSELYHQLQEIVEDQQFDFMGKISDVKATLENLKRDIIERTKSTINPEEQEAGKLVNRLLVDAICINNASTQIFDIIRDICRQAQLTNKVNIIPSAAHQRKRTAIATEKIMPNISSAPIAKHINDAIKRAQNIYQRLKIAVKVCTTHQQLKKHSDQWYKSRNKVWTRCKRLANQQTLFIEALRKTIQIIQEVADDRVHHITSLKVSRNKKIFDNVNEYQTLAIEHQGREEYDNFI